MAIIYLHGFASTGNSPKVDQLSAAFPDEGVVAPTLPPDPKQAIETIKNTVKQVYARGDKKILFLGTSMGGFYAWYASALYDAPAILVNPCIQPHQTTKQWLGQNKNFGSGETFEWMEEYLTDLEAMTKWVNAHYSPKLIHIEVALDDALLDAKEIISHFHDSGVSVNKHEEGGHRFDNWGRVFPSVRDRYDNIKEQIDPDPSI